MDVGNAFFGTKKKIEIGRCILANLQQRRKKDLFGAELREGKYWKVEYSYVDHSLQIFPSIFNEKTCLTVPIYSFLQQRIFTPLCPRKYYFGLHTYM